MSSGQSLDLGRTKLEGDGTLYPDVEGESRSWGQTQLGAVASELSGKWCQVSRQSCKRVRSSRDRECAAVTTDMIFTLTGLDKMGKQALGLSDISRTKDPAKQTKQQKLPSRKRSGGRGVPEDWNPNEQSAQKDTQKAERSVVSFKTNTGWLRALGRRKQRLRAPLAVSSAGLNFVFSDRSMPGASGPWRRCEEEPEAPRSPPARAGDHLLSSKSLDPNPENQHMHNHG